MMKLNIYYKSRQLTLPESISFIDRDHWVTVRENFLSGYDVDAGDIKKDENGEYFEIDPTLMDEGEPEDARSTRFYLPKELNSDYVSF